MSDSLDAIKSRISASHYDAGFTLSPAQIEELVSYAQEAPTSFNMQNWRVVAYASAEQKQALRAVCFDQPKVTDAAVALVFIGQTDGYKVVTDAFRPLVAMGLAGESLPEAMQNMANGLYEGNAQMQRDEAMRSCAFAAMTLMLAATAKGLVSCPMIGIDVAGVSKLAGVKANEALGLVLVVGKEGTGNWPRKPRRPLKDQLAIV